MTYLITLMVILGARRVQGHVLRRIPNVVWPIVAWACATVCFADPPLAKSVAAKFLPFVQQRTFVDSFDAFFALPAWARRWATGTAYVAMSAAMCACALWQRQGAAREAPIGGHRKDRALQYVDGLFTAGYLMHDERQALKEDIAGARWTARELADSLRKRLDAISICGAGGMDCDACAGLVRLIQHPSPDGGGGGGEGGRWPAPVVTGPLQELLGNGADANAGLVAAEEAFRVWLVASERDPRARYVAYADMSRALQAYFSRWCHAHRGLDAKDLAFMRAFLQAKLGQQLDPPGEIALAQFKLLWQWFYGFVAAINSCSLLRVAWDRRLIAGCVDRKDAEALARPREGNVCFRFSKELNTVANFALVASVHSAGGVLHVPIVVRPQNADRFLVTAKVPVAGQEGRHEFVTKYFRTFPSLFDTFYRSGWQTFQPAGRDTLEEAWTNRGAGT